MKESFEISYEQLDINNLDIILDGKDHQDDHIFIGNDIAMDNIEFSICLDNYSNNIYLSGTDDMYRVEFLKEYLSKNTNKIKKPDDWCYAFNFNNPNRPRAINLPSGMSGEFKYMLEKAVKDVILLTKNKFDSTEFKKVEACLRDEFIAKGEEKLQILRNSAKEMGFSTHISEKGIFFIPIIDGKKISEEEYDNLSLDEQEKILCNLDIIENKSKDIMNQVKTIKKCSEFKVEQLENEICKQIIDDTFIDIINKFIDNAKVIEHIKDLKQDLIHNIKDIMNNHDVQDKVKNIFSEIEGENTMNKYSVNLFIQHSEDEKIPIIYCKHASYYEMYGKIEYENELGIYSTDFTMIKKGTIHNANGGYLIIHAENLIRNGLVWETLKKMLFKKEIAFENIREQLGALPIKTIKPESIPLDLRIILLGNETIYRILYEYDSDFKELFKMHIQLDSTAEKTLPIINQYNSYMNQICKDNNFYPLTQSAKRRLLKYASFIAEDRNKLSTKFSLLKDVISESHLCAELARKTVIDDEQINEAMKRKTQRVYLYKKWLHEYYHKNKIKLHVSGETIGQINGISISDYGDSVVARIIRITAVTYMGKLGVVNIEKEMKLTGKIFNKGIGILSGYIGSKYAQEFPLSLNCQLCFEQMYSTIDGDSASCAELYTILSSLSNVPIKQCIAVTGSVDQFGNVQPVGSISNKIQGFYEACKIKGLSGEQGVIIPIQNVEEIVLEDEILTAVKDKQFHIYAIENIQQGISILTDTTIEEIDNRIHERLKKYYENSIQLQNGS